MNKTLANIIERLVNSYSCKIEFDVTCGGSRIDEFKRQAVTDMEYSYHKSKMRNKNYNTDEYLEQINHDIEEGKMFLAGRFDDVAMRKRMEVCTSRIELPYFKSRIEDSLCSRGIKCRLKQVFDGIELAVNLYDNYYMVGKVTMDNLERVIGMTDYFIKRPDRLKYDMPDFRLIALR